MSEFVRIEVALGARPYAVVVADAVDHLHGNGDPTALEALAWPVTETEFAVQLAAQASWPEVTDNDRLTLAFRDLDVAGIVAREDFTCCQNCGLSELGMEVADGEVPRGYAFYHGQDARAAAEGADLYVAYGLFGQPPTAEIGEEVATVLRGHGLTVDWNGDTGTRIRLPMTWQRRRTGRLAAMPSTDPDGGPDAIVEVEALDEWTGPYAPADGPMPAGRLALYLPWLPERTRVRLSMDGASVTVRREHDRLMGTFADPAVEDLTVARRQPLRLVRALRGDPVDGAAHHDTESGLLGVTYQHNAGNAYAAIPMELTESVALLRHMPPRSGAWASYAGASGGIVQVKWEEQRLWLESPDPAAGHSLGRHVTLAEAEQMITILAMADRVAVQDLDSLQTRPWT
jgi:hypothetical protein